MEDSTKIGSRLKDHASGALWRCVERAHSRPKWGGQVVFARAAAHQNGVPYNQHDLARGAVAAGAATGATEATEESVGREGAGGAAGAMPV